MKKHLKFLLLPVLASTPVMAVVACSPFVGLSDRDILSSALGRMIDNTFNMQEIKLESLPKNKEKYTDLSQDAKTVISDFYSNLVTNGETWDYGNVKVTISGGDKPENEFEQRYGDGVQSKITLNVNLEYKKLSASKEITVTIVNDKTDNTEKVKEIGGYLKNYLNNNNPSFAIDTLLPNNLTVADATNIYGKLSATLSKELLSKSVIDYPGVQLTLEPLNNEPATIIYQLEKNDSTKNEVTAFLQNLKLKLILSGQTFEISFDELNNKKLNLVQSYTSLGNQISSILNQAPSFLTFEKNDLPKANQSLADYDQDESLRGSVKTKLFEEIEKIYPKDKMGDGWTADLLEFTSDASSTKFILDPNNKSIGYFLVEITFNFNQTVKETAKDLHLNLYKK